jgi:NAD(P) transhydrogenase subunit alpha
LTKQREIETNAGLSVKVGIPKERYPGERRVAATPDSVRQLRTMGFEVAIEAGAGEGAGFVDGAYETAGAVIEPLDAIWKSDVILKVRPPVMADDPKDDEAAGMKEEATLISFLWPAQNAALLERLKKQNVSAIAMDAVPRITRAQKLDALSSMANIAGYRAVVEAANRFGRFFTGQITAAGKVPPAKVLVIGAGVAGLSAIGAAKGLGAVVRAFDTRLAAREQVESMGAEFLELDFSESGEGEGGYAKVMSKEFIDAEMKLFRAQAEEVDIIVTTALIPGKKAPTLITKETVEAMKPGSVVVDLAAEQGGNCEVTVPGEAIVHAGVTVIGYTDLPSRMAAQSSTLYANNLNHLLDDMGKAAGYTIDLEDEVVRGALVVHEGEIVWPPPAPKKAPVPKAIPKSEVKANAPAPSKGHGHGKPAGKSSPWPGVVMIGVSIALLVFGHYAPSDFLGHLTVFVLAIFVGWQVIWNVTPALHTPLMSVTNAISGIIIVGGMLHQQAGEIWRPATVLGAVAILIATINIAGGFAVTQRMLRMFRK